jgi:hypothetical protein
MTREESEAEADRILSEAGWTTTLKPPWRGRHVAPGLVGGRAPDGNAYAKAYSAFAQSEAAAMGLDPALYPDEPHEAAAVLVASIAAPVASAPEPEQIPQHETHGETGEEADGADAGAGVEDAGDDPSGLAGDPDGGVVGSESTAWEPDAEQPADVPIDADYTLPEIELIPPDPDPEFGAELLEWEGELAAEPEPEASGAFIFGDNLDQKRTVAIGLVMQIGLSLLPDDTDYARLSELRNFTLGVSEGRWPDDPAQRAELDVLEATERRRRVVEAARDTKVAYLMGATRELIEAFDPGADWP